DAEPTATQLPGPEQLTARSRLPSAPLGLGLGWTVHVAAVGLAPAPATCVNETEAARAVTTPTTSMAAPLPCPGWNRQAVIGLLRSGRPHPQNIRQHGI